MLHFCPFEVDVLKRNFKEMKMDNLAYEIVFMQGYKFSDLEETVLAGNKDYIHKGPDERLQKKYNDTSEHYMLFAGTRMEQSGLDRLLGIIDEATEKIANTTSAGSRYDSTSEDAITGVLLEYEEDVDGCYIISSTEDSSWGMEPIMKLFPCCPNCHMRLPLGWLQADEFCPISLLGRTGDGKTTYEFSLMAKDWEALRCSGAPWTTQPAHDTVEGRDYWYTENKKASARMARKGGQCPGNTQTEKKVAPLFLSVNYKGNRMIIGLYDNSGEVLRHMDPLDPRMILLSCMYGHIYLIGPEQLRLQLPVKEGTKAAESDTGAMVKVLSLEEQGRLQREHRGEQIKAEELLKPRVAATPVTEDPLWMLRDYQGLLEKTGSLEQMQKQHLCATVIKSDILRDLPEIQKFKHSAFLFQSGNPDDLFDDDRILARENILDSLFNAYVFPEDEPRRFIADNFASSSYHCVSALGCGTYEKEESMKVTEKDPVTGEVKARETVVKIAYLEDEYRPIRVAEPLVYCLKKKIEELGWG